MRATRLGTGGVNLSVLGVGVGATKGTTVLPGDVMIDGLRVVRDLARFVQGSDARGVLLHLNNLENLSEVDAAKAADILRDLRDPLLMQNGLHFVLVGTGDAITAVVQTHQQVRNTVNVLRLEPLAVADVHSMLAARYAHLRRDPTRPMPDPVEHAAIAQLHAMFQGDLRGLLKALEDGIEPLLGLIGRDGGTSPRPVTMSELREPLQARYTTELMTQQEPARVKQLTVWGENDPARTHTQKSLQALWKLKSQGGVSYALNTLVRAGYVLPLPRVGAAAIKYLLSGTSRLIFG